MSEPVSALGGVSFDGLARVEELGLGGMITLRGDLGARAVKSAIKSAAGVDLPGANQIATSDAGAVCWMSPDEVLVLCGYEQVGATIAALGSALAKQHHLVADVSDARAAFRVSGAAAREVVAKLCPVDLSPAGFGVGQFRRTRMAQVPAALWVEADGAVRIVCFRSVAEYVFGILKAAARPGSDVGYYPAG